MPLTPIKAGAALAFASFAVVVAPALAVSPLPLNEAPVFIPIQDEENKELWQDLRPDVTPPEAAVGTEGEDSKPVEKKITKNQPQEIRIAFPRGRNRTVVDQASIARLG